MNAMQCWTVLCVILLHCSVFGLHNLKFDSFNLTHFTMNKKELQKRVFELESELLEVRPLSVSDTFDVSDTYLKIIIEPNRIILKFRFATIQIRQKIRCL